jgi:hypothetical protein
MAYTSNLTISRLSKADKRRLFEMVAYVRGHVSVKAYAATLPSGLRVNVTPGRIEFQPPKENAP